MLRDGTHGVIGNTCGSSTADPGMIGEQRIKSSVAPLKNVQLAFGADNGDPEMDKTHIIQINVYASKMGQNKVSNSVRSLDGVRVVVKRV